MFRAQLRHKIILPSSLCGRYDTLVYCIPTTHDFTTIETADLTFSIEKNSNSIKKLHPFPTLSHKCRNNIYLETAANNFCHFSSWPTVVFLSHVVRKIFRWGSG